MWLDSFLRIKKHGFFTEGQFDCFDEILTTYV